jgi:hypothetical protein
MGFSVAHKNLMWRSVMYPRHNYTSRQFIQLTAAVAKAESYLAN